MPNKLLLLMWKNWKLSIRTGHIIFELIGPLLSCAIIIVLRQVPITEHKLKQFAPYDPLIHYPSSDQNNLAYAPCNNNIASILKKIKNVTVICYNSEQELEESITNDKTYFAGIQFENKYASSHPHLNNVLSIKFRFPPSIEKGQITDWFTSSIYSQVQKPGPRIPDKLNTGLPNYTHFLALQVMFAKAFAATTLNATDFPKILLQKYPHSDWIVDDLHVFWGLIGVSIAYFFSFPYGFLVESITTEKENQLKESMKIMGLPGWIHWFGWFLRGFLPQLLMAFIVTTLFKVNFSKQSVLKHSSAFILLIFFTIYFCSTICFAFLVSTFFSKASSASSFVLILNLIAYLPVLKDATNTLNRTIKIVFSLLHPNSAVILGTKTIILHETTQKGIQWSNMFKTVISNDLSVGVLLIILLIDSFGYLLLALYIEALFPGDFGVPHKWYFPFTRSYWCGEKENIITDVNESNKNNDSGFIEDDPQELHAGIQLKNLSKNFGLHQVVKQLNLNIYHGQITILLGHNGAGKTVTMSMITGMFSPSSGTAIVGGYDVRTNIGRVRDSIGLCLQHNVLFDKLTVEEHVYFFGRLKGLDNEEIKLETDTYLRHLQLEDKRKSYSCTLSGGMKRKLSVAISLCGNSKIVILDEPTAGMDPAARRTVWELLQKEKKDRTILLTTHYMDEADLLGDRIAIMCDGEVKCVGSSFFLKKKYGSGYYLVMEAEPNCDVNEVTNMLKKHISTVKLNSYIGSELSYSLSELELSKFEETLSDLEKNFKRLKINGYGLSLANMEEVFMKVGADQSQTQIITLEESIKTKFNTSAFLIHNHCKAMTIKKYKSILRNWFMFLCQLFVPPIILAIFILFDNTKNLKYFPALPLTLKSYPNSTILLSGNRSNEYYNLYKKLLFGHHIQETSNVAKVMLNVTKKTPVIARASYIVGATFEETSNKTKIIAWFNGDPYHAEPLSLQLVLNAILRRSNNRTYIEITNHPLNLSVTAENSQIDGKSDMLHFNMGIALSVLVGFFALFSVKERVTRSKHLQIVSGVHFALYWGLAYFWDMVIFLMNIILIALVLVIFKPRAFDTIEKLARLLLLLICYGLSFLPWVYLISKRAKNEALGFIAAMSCSLIYFVAFVTINFFIDHKQSHTAKTIGEVLRIIPFYCIIDGISKLILIYINNISETSVEIKNYFSMSSDLAIGWHLVILVVTALVFFVLLLLCESKYVQKNCKCSPKKPKICDDLDEDVVKENDTIRTTSNTVLNQNYTLVLRDVTKYYGKFLAVNNLCLGVKPYECFGLLGINGAGKTTTFQMMTGDEAMTCGEAWVNGFNINREVTKVHKSLGYCPQFDALLPDLTARDTLLIFALIRGIPYKDCRQFGENLAIQFDFFQYLDKKTKQLSGGNKRKLSAALAIMGNPTIIFLDEPTAGMDPSTRRFLWQVLCKVRDSGKTIILTSHSMEECEALCTRLAIMVNGKFECIGSSQRLKNKFAQGYTVTIKLRKYKNAEKLQKEAEDIEKFVKYQFTGATLQDKHEQLMTFFIPTNTLIPCSAIFGILEDNKSHLNIEDYAIGQSSLEQVFLSFTKIET